MKNRKHFFTSFLLLCLIQIGLAQELPLASLKLWLRADSVLLENGRVKLWYDLSGNNNHALQTIPEKQPLYIDTVNSIYNNQVIRFDGLNDFMQFPNQDSIRNVFIVFKHASGYSSTYQPILGDSLYYDFIGNTGNKLFNYGYLSNAIKNGLIILNADSCNGQEINKPTQYSLLNIQSTDNLRAQYITNDRNQFGYWEGDFAEIIMFDSLLTQEETSQVHLYLQEKYTPAVNLGYDINVPYGFCDTTITTAPKSWFKSYIWSTGETTSTISVNNPGTYSVTVTDVFGFESTDSVKVEFTSPSLENSNICLGDSVLYEPNLADYQYLWSNGSTDSSLWIKEQGNYSLVLTDSNSCSSTFNFTVKVDSFANHIGFKYDTISLCAGNTINLDYGQDKCTSFLWSPSNNTTPQVQVDTSGWKTVSVQNQLGCQAKDSVFVNITGKAPDINYSVDNLCFGESTNFTDLSTSNENIIETKWFFSSTDSLIGTSVAKTFDTIGTQNIILKVVAESGCYNTESFEVEVLDIANISFNNNPICVGIENNFAPDLNIPQGSSIVNFDWKVNNTSVANTQNLDYTFSSSGIYQVELSVELDNGCITSFSKEVIVESAYELSDNLSLVSPNNASIFENNQNINFSWNPNPLAVDYLIQISDMEDFSNILLENHTDSNVINLNINLNIDTLYWRVKAYNPCLIEHTSNTHSIVRFDNETLSHKVLWFRSDSVLLENGRVKLWYDLSGNNNHASQTIPKKQPTYVDTFNTLYNKKVIRFDGIDDFMAFPAQTSLRSIFMVLKHASGNSHTYQPILGDSLYYDFIGSTGTKLFNYGYLSNAIKSGLTILNLDSCNALDINKPTQYSLLNIQATDSLRAQYITNDRNQFGYWEGDFVEIIMFDSLLTQEETSQVHHYLQEKYTPSVNLGYDINIPYGFCDTTITTAPKSWFKSYIWSTGETTPTISVNNPGTYSVTVTDIFGFESTDSIEVTYPKFNLLANQTICFGDTISWELAPKAPYEINWNTGETTSAIDIFNEGTYSVTITDTLGNSWSPQPIYIAVDSFPVTTTLGADLTLCSGNRVKLKVGQEEAIDYLWSDGSTGDYYHIGETEQITVQVISERGCIAYDTIDINVAGKAPTANFSFDKLCRNIAIQFENLSVAYDNSSIVSYNWDFNGEGLSYQSNPNYIFDSAKEVFVTLHVLTNEGCANDTTHYLQIHELPQADFSPKQVCENITQNITNTSSSADGEIVSNYWNINNEIFTDENPAYTFTNIGQNNVKLIATTEFNCSDTIIDYITVKPAPKAAFSFSTACVGHPIFFNNLSTSHLGQQLSSQWQFGNLDSSTQIHPTFTFENSGEKTIQLIISQLGDGCKDTSIQTLKTHNLPKVILDSQGGCKNTTINLEQNSSWGENEQAGIIKWQIEDSVFFGENPSVIKQNEGNYNLKIEVTNKAGCIDTTSNKLNIYPTPKISFAPLEDTIFVPSEITLDNTSDNANYQWMVNQTTFSNLYNPSYTFDTAGLFIFTLEGVNENECFSSQKDTIRALVPTIDGAILECRALINQGRLFVSVELMNIGSKNITNPELQLTMSNGQIIAETFAGTIYSGQEKTYSFRSQYFINDNVSLKWITVELVYTADQILTNNTCTHIFSETTEIFQPYPNPVGTTLNIDFIALKDGNAKLILYNLIGKLVLKENYNVVTGLNRIQIPNPSLNGGLHTLEIEVNGVRETFRIVL